MGFRSLRVINDDIVAPGQGFGEHGHDNMEILTWVLDGALKHGDSLRHAQTLKPGELQVMTAGTGIRHSEFNASSDQPVRFLQIWIEPSEPNVQPRYLQQAFAAAARHNRWDTLASGRTDAPPAALPIHQDATLRVADLDPGASITLDMATGRHAYVHVARGGVTVLDQTLTDGDAFTTDTPGALTLTASAAGAQVLAFDLA
jgi:redox-sensitive bicupin YhaK (pirin superfamily)